MIDRPPLEQELQDLSTAFGAARHLLIQDQPVDLTGLDEQVKTLCDHVRDASPEERKKIEPGFIALQSLLKDLDTELRLSHERTQRAVQKRDTQSPASSREQDS